MFEILSPPANSVLITAEHIAVLVFDGSSSFTLFAAEKPVGLPSRFCGLSVAYLESRECLKFF